MDDRTEVVRDLQGAHGRGEGLAGCEVGLYILPIGSRHCTFMLPQGPPSQVSPEFAFACIAEGHHKVRFLGMRGRSVLSARDTIVAAGNLKRQWWRELNEAIAGSLRIAPSFVFGWLGKKGCFSITRGGVEASEGNHRSIAGESVIGGMLALGISVAHSSFDGVRDGKEENDQQRDSRI